MNTYFTDRVMKYLSYPDPIACSQYRFSIKTPGIYSFNVLRTNIERI